LELAIGALVGVIALAYVAQMFLVPLAWGEIARGTFVPSIADSGALVIAVGIIGATVMPHALFLHSGLSGERIQPASEAERAKLVRFANREVVIALAVAGFVNMAMVVMACGAFHRGNADVVDIGVAYQTLTPLVGSMAAALFLTSLMASGISSSVVGT